MLPTSWLTQMAFVTPSARHLLAATLASLVFGLTNVRQNAELSRHIAAGIHRNDRNPRVDCGLDRIRERIRIGNGNDKSLRARRNRGIDQLSHCDHIEGGGGL